MAFGALQRRGLIKKNLLAGDRSECLVTQITFDVGVPALERELRSFIVIKNGGHPSCDIVAVCARRFPGFGDDELTAVFIRVTLFAGLRCPLKLRLL